MYTEHLFGSQEEGRKTAAERRVMPAVWLPRRRRIRIKPQQGRHIHSPRREPWDWDSKWFSARQGRQKIAMEISVAPDGVDSRNDTRPTAHAVGLEFGHFNSEQNQKFVPRPLGEGAAKRRVRVLLGLSSRSRLEHEVAGSPVF